MEESVLDTAMANLRKAIFDAYAVFTEHRAKHGTEMERRERAIEDIDEGLERRPLATFSAAHLELLDLLFAYWRELEVAEDAPLRAPSPDPVQ